ncbi:MAG: thioredoxin family protein [Planctomycetes bacterium]|nr:thioredoxin family protein [Planctomycetota bacterium]
MNFFQRLVAVGVTLAAPALALAGDSANWIADFDKAVETAKAQKKDLFVDFTGSDWCGWCKKLDAEVFSKSEFLDAVQKDYVLVSLDFPRAEEVKKKVPNPQRNDELAQKYGIQGFPTVLLMTVDGEVFAQTGYQAGGPVKYVESLASMRESGRKALVECKEIVAKFGAAFGEEKNILLDRALRTLESLSGDSPFASQLSPVVRTAFTSDPENKQGRKLRAVKALLKAGEYDAELDKLARELDPKNENALLERVIFVKLNSLQSEAEVKAILAEIVELDKLGIKDTEIKENCYAASAYFNMEYIKDTEAAKSWAEKLKAIAGDKPQYQPLFDQILG